MTRIDLDKFPHKETTKIKLTYPDGTVRIKPWVSYSTTQSLSNHLADAKRAYYALIKDKGVEITLCS